MFKVRINKQDTIMLTIYVSVCVALRVSFLQKHLLQHDLAAYLVPAESILSHFEFLNQSGQPMAFSAPLYPILIAIFKKIFGLYWVEPLIALQCFLLFQTGILLKKFIQMYDAKLAQVGAYLLVFNPNSLGAAHALQTETVFTFFLFWSTVNFVFFIKQDSPKHLYIATLLAAIAVYTRPAGFYWGYSLPAIVFLGALFQHDNKTRSVKFLAKHAILSFIFLSILLAPWQTRNYLTFGYYNFTSNKGLYLRDNLLSLYRTDDMSLDDANLKFNKGLANYCLSMKIPCDGNNPFFMSKTMSDFVISDLKQTNPTLIVKTGLKSLIMLIFPPGTGLFREAWGINNLNIGGVSSGKGFTGITEAAKALFNHSSPFYLAFFGLSLAFSVTIKLLATAGIVRLVKTETATIILFLLSSTILLAASYIFLGQPRFRVPLEPIFTYFAMLGLHRLCKAYTGSFGKVSVKNNKS